MKTHLQIVLVCVFLFFTFNTAAQGFNFLISPQSQCYSPGNNTATAIVTSTAAGATSYSWTILSSTCAPTFTAVGNGTMINISFSCWGNYTINCMAYTSGNPAPVANASQTTSVLGYFGIAMNITMSTATICSGAEATLSASGANNYTWMPGNTTGSTIVVSPTTASCYSVTGEYAHCTGTAQACVHVQTCTAISDPSPEPGIVLYPNPSMNQLTLQFPDITKTTVTIYDVLGKKILSAEFTGSKTFNISDWSEGTYVMMITSAYKTIYKKVVVSR